MTDMENPTPVDKTQTPPPLRRPPPGAHRAPPAPEPVTTLPVGGSTALTTGPRPQPRLTPGSSTPGALQPSSQITIDDFAKVELRVAQILVAERIPKADKLLRLEVDLGPLRQAPDPLGHRRVVRTRRPHRPPHRRDHQPRAPQDARARIPRHATRRLARRRSGKPVLATFGEDIALGSRLK